MIVKVAGELKEAGRTWLDQVLQNAGIWDVEHLKYIILNEAGFAHHFLVSGPSSSQRLNQPSSQPASFASEKLSLGLPWRPSPQECYQSYNLGQRES